MSSDRWRKPPVTEEEILFFHNDIITLDGGAFGIRDEGALEAAVARPQTAFGGVQLFSTPFARAAALTESLIQRHPFVDGNKRTGIKAGGFLLFLEGYLLTASQEELTEATLEVANHHLDVQGLAQWLKNNSRSIRQRSTSSI